MTTIVYKKIFILSLLILLIGAMGIGCKGLTQEEQVAVRPVALNYWTVFNDAAQLRALAAEYNKVRTHVTVNIRQVRYEQFNDLFINALAADVPPDIVSIHTRDLRKYLNHLSPMPPNVNVSNVYTKGEYFKETIVTTQTIPLPSASYVRNNYVSTVYDDAVIGGKVYGLPLALDTLAIYYNKDLLDKVGIPEPPADWQEFMEAVQASAKFDEAGEIAQSGVALGTGNNIDNAFDILSLLMMQSGTTMAKGSYVGFAAGLKKPSPDHSTLRAMQFYTDFAQPTKEVYSWNEEMENALNNFAAGKSVFFLGFAYDNPRIRARAPQMNLEVIPVPQLNEQAPVNVANYWIESVVKKSRHQNEAWDFVRFITSPDNVKKYTKATRRPTPLRAQIVEQREDELLAPFVEQVLNAENWYRGRNYGAAQAAFKKMIHDYLQPFEETKKSKLKRDAEIVDYAAKVIQQTM